MGRSGIFKVFVLEDNDWFSKMIEHSLSRNPDISVRCFFKASDMMNALNERPDLVTLDYKLPDMNGDQVLKLIKSQYP